MEDLIADVLTVARQGQEIGDTELVSLDAIVTECWDAVQNRRRERDRYRRSVV